MICGVKGCEWEKLPLALSFVLLSVQTDPKQSTHTENPNESLSFIRKRLIWFWASTYLPAGCSAKKSSKQKKGSPPSYRNINYICQRAAKSGDKCMKIS